MALYKLELPCPVFFQSLNLRLPTSIKGGVGMVVFSVILRFSKKLKPTPILTTDPGGYKALAKRFSRGL